MLISYVGTDLISVINFLISENNLNKDSPVLFGDSGKYLNTCFNDNGDLADLFNMTGSETNQIQELRDLTDSIAEIKEKTKENDLVISEYKNRTAESKSLKNVGLYDITTTQMVNFTLLQENFNNLLRDTIFDMWTLNDTCSDDSFILVHLPDSTNV